MVFKILIIKSIILIFLLSAKILFANIIYEKNNIFITEIELLEYIKLYENNYETKIEINSAIKNIVLMKKTIKIVENNNPDFIRLVDESLKKSFGVDINNPNTKNFYRYLKIRNEFISEYFQNEYTFEEFVKFVTSLELLNLPISENKCLTIVSVINLNENNFFLKNLYENLKKNTGDFEAKIDSKIFDVCINQNKFRQIESSLIQEIERLSEQNFNKFIYGNRF